MRRSWRFLTAAVASSVLALAGCGNNGGTVVVQQPSGQRAPLNPNALQQFGTPLVELPVAPADPANPTTYNVSVRQGTWDFGLRLMDGSQITDSATGKPIVTKTWGYEVNGVFLGAYGPTVEVNRGTQLTFNYSNDLRDEINGVKGTGPYLTKHLLQVDPTIDGTSMGEPECRIITHLHGGEVGPESDGHPDAWVTNDPAVQAKWAKPIDLVNGVPARPATNKLPPFVYPNAQQAATLWFHDHTMGITRLNAYAGVAAFYLIKDPATEAPLNLPTHRYANPVVPTLQSDEFDLPLVLQDKDFTEDGSLVFPTFTNLGAYTFNALRDSSGNTVPIIRPEMFGNVITVNGKAWPYKTVKNQPYRFRIVNGSDSRVYNIWLQDADTGEIITPNLIADLGLGGTWPVVQIAADQGYAAKAVDVATGPGDNGLMVPNGGRVDIIIDFSHPIFNGRNIVVRNDCPAPFGGVFGPAAEDPTTLDPKTTGKVMMFKVPGASAGQAPLLASLKSSLVPFAGSDAPVKTRYVDFQERKDPVYTFLDPTSGVVAFRTQLLLNNMRFSDPVTEKPVHDTTEEWVLINTTPDVHPMHLHLVKFEVVEKGYIDNVSFPGAYTRADGVALPKVSNPAAFIASSLPPTLGGGPAPPNSVYAVAPNEQNVWKDTVFVPPAGTPFDAMTDVQYPGYVRIRAKFPKVGNAPNTAYMWHCHILSHEENDMMRPFILQ